MAETLSSKMVMTRTPHVCFGCGRKFPPKTPMQREGVQDGGSVFTCYLCGTCQDVMSDFESGDEFCFGDLRDDALEREAAQEGAEHDN